MWRTWTKLVTVLSFAVLCGCISLPRADREFARELEGYGIEPDEQAIKNPGLAGALNILPGFGNFYLAAGDGDGSMWAVGFLNLLFWPFSVVWGVPEAAVDAETINTRETIYYYRFSEQGKRILKQKREEAQPGQ